MKEMILKFWKRWFGKESAGQVANPISNEAEATLKNQMQLRKLTFRREV